VQQQPGQHMVPGQLALRFWHSCRYAACVGLGMPPLSKVHGRRCSRHPRAGPTRSRRAQPAPVPIQRHAEGCKPCPPTQDHCTSAACAAGEPLALIHASRMARRAAGTSAAGRPSASSAPTTQRRCARRTWLSRTSMRVGNRGGASGGVGFQGSGGGSGGCRHIACARCHAAHGCQLSALPRP
jgi:hypothetical protein